MCCGFEGAWCVKGEDRKNTIKNVFHDIFFLEDYNLLL